MAKALVCARVLGFKIDVHHQGGVAKPFLKNGDHYTIGGHGIIKYLCLTRAGAVGLYPWPPYNAQSNLKASQIDGWMDFGSQLITSFSNKYDSKHQVKPYEISRCLQCLLFEYALANPKQRNTSMLYYLWPQSP